MFHVSFHRLSRITHHASRITHHVSLRRPLTCMATCHSEIISPLFISVKGFLGQNFPINQIPPFHSPAHHSLAIIFPSFSCAPLIRDACFCPKRPAILHLPSSIRAFAQAGASEFASGAASVRRPFRPSRPFRPRRHLPSSIFNPRLSPKLVSVCG